LSADTVWSVFLGNIQQILSFLKFLFVTSLRNNIQKIHEIVRKTLKTAQETMKRDYDSKMREVEYQPGDFVYVLDTAHIKGRAASFQYVYLLMILWHKQVGGDIHPSLIVTLPRNIGRHPSKCGCIVQPVHWPKVCKE
jgi:hypothetical protein